MACALSNLNELALSVLGSFNNDSTASLAKSLLAKLVIVEPLSAKRPVEDFVVDKEASALGGCCGLRLL